MAPAMALGQAESLSWSEIVRDEDFLFSQSKGGRYLDQESNRGALSYAKAVSSDRK